MNTPIGKLGQSVSTAFDPRQIPGCALWIDAADANTVTLSGNNITSLLDKSSNAYVFATASGFTYNVVKFNTSYPSFYCPTSSAGYSLGSNTSFALNQPFTAFAVGGNLISPSSGGYFWDSTSNANRAALVSYNPGQPVMFAGAEVKSTNTTSFTGAIILSCFYNSTSSFLFENGSNVSSTNNVGTQNAISLRLGAAWSSTTNWNGHICEILFFNRIVTTTEQRQIEGYLASKWGLRGNIAATHPFKSLPPIVRMFQPTDITGCTLWLDAADATTLTLSGSNVTQWRDKSGNGRNASGGVSPTYTPSTGVTFNGSTQYLTLPGAAIPTGNSASSYFAVVYPTNVNTNAPKVYLTTASDTAATNSYILFIEANGINTKWALYLNNVAQYFTSNAVANQFSLTEYVYTPGTGVAGYLNGSQQLTYASASLNIGNTNVYIGGSPFQTWWFPGSVSEIVVYNQTLTTPQRQQIEGYLADKWGVRGSLASTHPFKLFPPLTSAFTPLQISGCSLWYDGSDKSTLALSGSNVTSWTSKGTSATVVSTASSNAPYVSTAYNGLGTIRYTFGSHLPFLNSSVSSSVTQTSGNHSIFLVHTPNANNASPFAYVTSAAANRISAHTPEGSNVAYDGNSRLTYSYPSAATYLNGALRVECFYRSNSVLYYRRDGTQLTSAAATTATFDANQLLYIGGVHPTYPTYYYGGDFCEIIWFNVGLSTSDIQLVEGYLAHKWGLLNSLPASHPYKKFRP